MMRRLDDRYGRVSPATQRGMLSRDGGHEVYWQVSGPDDGLPVVLVHGGPGGACADAYTALFPGARWRVIQFDQRGCGRSTPRGCLTANTLAHTLGDMEALREHLGLDRWVVSGGSWGSTVSLAYAEAHPERCLALMLVATWLLRREDIHWWLYGVRHVFPELWEEFAGFIPPEERGDLAAAYCRRILGEDRELADAAATRLYLYEEGFMHFDAPLAGSDPARGPAYGRIFAHYLSHDFFLADNQLLRDAGALRELPVSVVTGRYDMCTPPSNAYDLVRMLPQARHRVVAGAGHYPTEHALARACVEAVEELAHALDRPWGREK